MNKPMTNVLRDKIKMYIKNGVDISPLIKDIDIKGEDLSRAIIKDINRPDDNISGCNFHQAVIGEEGKITNLSRIDGRNCNFHRAKFLGTIWARYADLRNCNFQEVHATNMDYRFADLRNCNFCEAMFCIGSSKGIGAKFDEGFLKDLGESWGVEVRLKSKEELENLKKKKEV